MPEVSRFWGSGCGGLWGPYMDILNPSIWRYLAFTRRTVLVVTCYVATNLRGLLRVPYMRKVRGYL